MIKYLLFCVYFLSSASLKCAEDTVRLPDVFQSYNYHSALRMPVVVLAEREQLDKQKFSVTETDAVHFFPIHVTNLRKQRGTICAADMGEKYGVNWESSCRIGWREQSRDFLAIKQLRKASDGRTVFHPIGNKDRSLACLKVGDSYCLVILQSDKTAEYLAGKTVLTDKSPPFSHGGSVLTVAEQKEHIPCSYLNGESFQDESLDFLIKKALRVLSVDIKVKTGKNEYGYSEKHIHDLRADEDTFYIVNLEVDGLLFIDSKRNFFVVRHSQNALNVEPVQKIEEKIKLLEGLSSLDVKRYESEAIIEGLEKMLTGTSCDSDKKKLLQAIAEVAQGYSFFLPDSDSDSDDESDQILDGTSPQGGVSKPVAPSPRGSRARVAGGNRQTEKEWRFHKSWLAVSGGLGALGLGAGGFALNREQRVRRLNRLIAGVHAEQLGKNNQKLRALYRSRRNARWGMYGGSGVSVLALIGALLALRQGIERVDVPA